MNAFSLLRIELKPSKYLVVLYTAIYLIFLHLINSLFTFSWSTMMALGVVTVFYVVQVVSYIRRTELLEMPVSPEYSKLEELPALSLNDKAYRVLPSSVLLPSYILLELKEEGVDYTPSLWRRFKLSRQLMIFPDQCRREEFHTLIRMIRLSFGR
ncbi:protein YgfX [Litoribrevibacter euphylliae]|uniref:Protein YgfX n=1 Tax=Litoribrevibacter euphylliae TaxID=1834034 RepID=A0ABV7HA88_9GAMM